MRILAIRGRNIASLAGSFEVDFRAEPLASAGLFAICGATGSGKSTLLDVLCLALYDATPRLLKAKSQGTVLPDVQNETLTPQDSRNLLRRGTADGFAEVDFVGNDGQDYRARWSVRRARGKVDGRLQATEMSLRQLPADTPVGGSLKTEVQDAIKARLGLEFEQFVRAVLLAQNEFTAFLHASDNDRALLLERLTGSEHFSDLSRRAFERSKVEQETLASIERRLGDLEPLDADGRAALELDAAAAATEADRAAADQRQVDEHLRWHAEHARAAQAELDARQAREAADCAWTDATTRRALLDRIEAVQPARLLVTDADRTAASLAECRERLVPEAIRQDTACREALQHATAEEDAAKAAAAAADARRQQAAPDLERARALDAQIGDLYPRVARAAADLRDAAGAAKAAQDQLASARRQHDAALAERDLHATWLAAHAAWRPLADGWARWDTLLTQAADAHGAATRIGTELRAAGLAAEQCLQQSRVASETVGLARAEAEASALALADADASLATFDAAGLLAEREALDPRAALLRAAQHTYDRLAEIRERQASVEHSAREQANKAGDADRQAAALDAERQRAEAAREQAERAHDEAKQAASASVEKLRAALETGRPCPVCGATDHPYTSADHAFGDVLKVLKAQLKACAQRVQELTQDLEARRATAREAAARATDLQAELRGLAATAASVEDAWRLSPVASEVAALDPDACRAWFSSELTRVDAARQALADREKAFRAAGARRDDCRTARDAALARLRDAERAADVARLAQAEAAAVVTHTRAALTQAEAARDGTLVKLDEPFQAAPWRSDWLAAPDVFRQSLAAQVAEYSDHVRRMNDAGDLSGRVAASLAGLEAAARGAESHAAQATSTDAALRQQLAQAQAARAGLFDGRAAGDVSRELEDAVAAARARADASAQAVTDARTASAAAQARLDGARRALEHATAAAAEASRALDAWVAEFNDTDVMNVRGRRLPSTLLGTGQPASTRVRLKSDATTATDTATDSDDTTATDTATDSDATTATDTATDSDDTALRMLLAHDDRWVISERSALRDLDQAKTQAIAVHDERRGLLDAVAARRATDESADALTSRRAALAQALDAARARQIGHEAALRQDDDRRQSCTSLQAEILHQRGVADVWARLSDLIGSADGKRFRNYAQQLSLDVLLRFANVHLADLSRRYRLRRIDDKLGLAVIDRDMGDDMRSIHSLSGGESFLVSLALALGLASLSANRVRVESLFIDEGFGSLDADTLSVAIDALERLHAQGRKVGVISHVTELASRIGTRIQVERQSIGRSRIDVRR